MECPICEKELKGEYSYGEHQEICLNGCFAEEYSYGAQRYFIFDAEFYDWEKALAQIEYWRENYRYVAEILERG